MATNLYALVEARPGHPTMGKPFYVGIGTAKRPYEHLAQSRRKKGHRNLRLHEILVSHRALGIAPTVMILGVFETKDEAANAEKNAIALYGRIGIEPDGILCNLACGGQGPVVALMQLPEIRKRVSEGQRRRSPESKAASLVGLEKTWHDPEVRAKKAVTTAKAARKRWADPKKRAQMQANMKGVKKTDSPEALAARRANAMKANTPEANAKKAEAIRQRWSDPEYKARLSKKRKETWDDPTKRAAMLAGRAEGISKSWGDPEVRARRIAGIKASAAKRAKSDDGQG